MSYPVYTHAAPTLETRPGHVLITVRVEMPHVAKYNKNPVMELTYASADNSVRPGQSVLCPPTRLNSSWTTGTVLAVHADAAAAGYTGRVKYVKPLPRKRRR